MSLRFGPDTRKERPPTRHIRTPATGADVTWVTSASRHYRMSGADYQWHWPSKPVGVCSGFTRSVSRT